MAKGIKSIIGEKNPKVGESYIYEVSSYYPNTPKNGNNIQWKLYVMKNNGSWRELRGPLKTGIKAPFQLPEKWLGKKMMIEAFIYNPEKKSPPGLIITPIQAKIPEIKKVELRYHNNSPGTVFSFSDKLIAQATCVNLFNKELTATLWEDDTAGNGHHNKNNIIKSVKSKVDENGIAKAEFLLTEALIKKALEGEIDVKQIEFYVTFEYYAHKKHATNNIPVDNPISENPSPPLSPKADPPVDKTPPDAVSSKDPKDNIPEDSTPPEAVPKQDPVISTPENTSDPAQPTTSAQTNGTIENTQPPAPPESATSPAVVNEVKIENLLDAYFAKIDYTKKTGNEAGIIEYTFGSNGNNTDSDSKKENIAKIILGKPAVTALKDQKQYTTLEAIKAALTKDVYNKNEKVSIKTFKLGVEFVKVSCAPLEEKLYLMARTSMLDGKQATLIIKEKDGIIKGSSGATLPVLEITEEQMEQKSSAGEVQGTEKTEFKGTVKDGIVKIPIHLRPKSDNELKQWKEKLSKGKEDGTYTYTFSGITNIKDANEKRSIAGIILSNAKDGKKGNPKIENGKTSTIEEIEKVLQIRPYGKDEKIIFKLYKITPELLYINAKAQGDKQHNKEFLKQDGGYFEIGGGKCSCNRDLTESEFKEILKHLRESERLEINNIWKPRNPGGANPSETSVASTLDKLNEVMKKYEINSCIRKVYFIAECYCETDRFYSTREYNSSHTPRYDPYRGRGIIQLTHKEAYERYSFYRNDNSLLTNLDQLATNLDLAFDSAGWYFKQGKRLSVGDSWSPNSTDQKKYNLNTRSYPKSNYDTNFTNTDGSIVKRYGSINLNLVADNDDINVISYLINGGDNGLSERKKYLAELKKVSVFICDKNNTQPSSGDWHDPVDNPISTNFYQNGNFDSTSKIWGLFGNDIRKEVSRKHTGLDFFAERRKPIYACVDGTVYNRRWHTGYGNTITIKVKDPKAFMARKRTDYTRKTIREMENGASWSDSGDIFLFYAHLHSVNEFTFGQEVKCGKQLGTTGRSGVAGGTCAPHLHFEILSSYSMGVGTSYRINPAYFINYKFYDEQSESERNAQTNEKNRGKINEVNGAVKLNERNLN